ncbi:MAG: SpoIID/LytB domain-containing protein [Bdellovibrionales bacterium]
MKLTTLLFIIICVQISPLWGALNERRNSLDDGGFSLSSLGDGETKEKFEVKTAPEAVRVRIQSNVSTAVITGEEITYDGFMGKPATVTFKRFTTDEWYIDGRRWKSKSFQEFLRVKGKHLRVNDQEVPGDVELKSRSNGKIDVIAALPLDTYLVGVLAGEVVASWPGEALRAQAVVARTYTVQFLQNQRYKTFDIDSSQLDQVFRHLGAKAEQEKRALRMAVDETKNQVLYNSRGQLMSVYYHSDCGGVTERPTSVWDQQKTTGVLGRQPVTRCPLRSKVNWETFVPSREVQAILNNKSRLQRFYISSRLPSSRVNSVTAEFADGTIKALKANEFRKLFGYMRIKSALFDLRPHLTGYSIKGRGFGHGVGLCQWGSKWMADQGRDYFEIAMHYFPQARVVTLRSPSPIKNR